MRIRGLYKRGDVYWFSRQINGRRSFVSLETSDLEEAITRRREILDAGVLPDGETLGPLVERYVAACRASGKWTRASEDSKLPVLKRWAEAMGAVSPESVSTDQIRAWHDRRVGETCASTAYGNLMLLRGFFNWCLHEAGLTSRNPAEALTARRNPARVPQPKTSARADFCTPELRDRLIAECPRDDLRFILYCGFHAGLRKAEIIEAKAEWFDLRAGLLHLRKHAGIQFKDSEERTIPLTQEFREWLKKNLPRSGYILAPWKETRGRSIYRYDFERFFSDYMAQKKCPWVTPHIMRHTFASLLASAGVSIFKIATWLGDEVRVVEKHYAKLLPKDSEIERAFSSPPSAKTRRLPRKAAAKRTSRRRSRKA
jgi:integrase/recombinase XerC